MGELPKLSADEERTFEIQLELARERRGFSGGDLPFWRADRERRKTALKQRIAPGQDGFYDTATGEQVGPPRALAQPKPKSKDPAIAKEELKAESRSLRSEILAEEQALLAIENDPDTLDLIGIDEAKLDLADVFKALCAAHLEHWKKENKPSSVYVARLPAIRSEAVEITRAAWPLPANPAPPELSPAQVAWLNARSVSDEERQRKADLRRPQERAIMRQGHWIDRVVASAAAADLDGIANDARKTAQAWELERLQGQQPTAERKAERREILKPADESRAAVASRTSGGTMYPTDFSDAAVLRIESTYRAARRRFREARAADPEPPPDNWRAMRYTFLLFVHEGGADPSWSRVSDYRAFLEQALPVLQEFVGEAIELVKEGKWRVDRACHEIEKVFLEKLFKRLYDEDGRDRFGKRFPDVMIGGWQYRRLDPRLVEWLSEDTNEWRKYEDQIEALPKQIASRVSPEQTAATEPYQPPSPPENAAPAETTAATHTPVVESAVPADEPTTDTSKRGRRGRRPNIELMWHIVRAVDSLPDPRAWSSQLHELGKRLERLTRFQQGKGKNKHPVIGTYKLKTCMSWEDVALQEPEDFRRLVDKRLKRAREHPELLQESGNSN